MKNQRRAKAKRVRAAGGIRKPRRIGRGTTRYINGLLEGAVDVTIVDSLTEAWNAHLRG